MSATWTWPGRLRTAIDAALKVDGVRTGDLGGTATTAQFADAVVARLGPNA